VFLTGEPAEEAVEKLAGIHERVIHDHEELAEATLGTVSVAGLLALGLLGWRRRRILPRAALGLALAVVVGVGGLLARTAWLGGQIRHTEIAGGAASQAEADDDR
jgi:MYXO-CTERM domain-containing protein